MGSLKEEAIKGSNEDIQQHKLLTSELNYLQLLNLSLQYHTFGQKILSGFLYYVCTQRLGYKDGVNLMFEMNFEDGMLTVKLLPHDISQQQAQAEAAANQMAKAPTPPAANAKDDKPKA